MSSNTDTFASLSFRDSEMVAGILRDVFFQLVTRDSARF